MRKIVDQIWRDFGVIILSIFVAVELTKSGAITDLLNHTRNFWFVDSFIAGIFFTSAFTTAPAIVAIAAIARASDSLIPLTLFGGLGALCGDLILFYFFRDSIRDDILYFSRNVKSKRIRAILTLRLFRWITFLIGALIIASPLPDELGIFLMGLSKTKTKIFILTSFLLNATGIFIIGLIARAL